MPRTQAERDRYIETVAREDKYFVGQVIKRYGKSFKITRIVENDGEWDIYGVEE